MTVIPIPSIRRILKSERNPAKRIREEEEGQRNGANSRRKPGVSGVKFAPTMRGCTGFDGGMEAGQAGGGA